MPVHVINESKLDKKQPYVFCANHTSVLDIAVMGVVLDQYYAFIGKSSLAKLPLFGYMFTRLHIAVDRSSRVSSYKTMHRALETLDKGRSLMIFPEGGIVTENPPLMTPFKDGPFRMAVEKQVPIVPVTLPFNWYVLPDDSGLLFRWHELKAIVHKPILTQGMTLEDVPQLKQMTFNVIDAELKKYALNNHVTAEQKEKVRS